LTGSFDSCAPAPDEQGGKWLIEGMSLVSNYRSQSNKIINGQGYSELVKKLRTKSEEFKAP